MTKNLIAKGSLERPLLLYNRTRSRAEEHSVVIGHSAVAETLESAVNNSDILWSCLENQEAVLATFEEILSKDIQGKLFVESSTILPNVTEQIAARVMAAGAEFIALPGRSAFLF